MKCPRTCAATESTLSAARPARCASAIRPGCINEAVSMKVQLRVQATVLEISVVIENNSRQTWTPGNFSLGWQLYDPRSEVFIEEGAWTPVPADVPPGSSAEFDIAIPFQPDSGSYEVYISPIQQPDGWAYARGERFVRIGVEAVDGQLRILEHEITTVRSLRWRR